MGRWYSQEKSETFAKRTSEPEPQPSPQPSFKERTQSRIQERMKIKRLEREPVVREREMKIQKSDIDLRKRELDTAREMREIRARRFKESAPVRGLQVAGKGVKYTTRKAQQFQQYQQRQAYQRQYRQYYQPSPLGIAPGSIGGGRMSSIGLPQTRPIGPSSMLSPSPSRLPIHGISSIRSSGYTPMGPSVSMGGRIPKGLIKSYWSKKVKVVAKANIKQYGPDEGLARTRQIAEELGWKMQ